MDDFKGNHRVGSWSPNLIGDPVKQKILQVYLESL